jgi:zinc transport system substrate-binding protein
MRIRRHKAKFVMGLFGLSVLLTASASPNSELIKPKVYVTAYPLKYFVERIAGETVNVVFPVPDGLDPIFWMPDPETIADIQKADLIILNGATYEKWLAFVSLPPSKLVDTSVGFKHLYIQDPDSMTHSHGPQGEHSHTGIRHTTWLDFSLAANQAKAIEIRLSHLLPDSKRELRNRYLELERDLMKLDQQYGRVFAKISHQSFLASHPEYSYLARRYSLNLESLLWSPEVMPTPGQWKEVRGLLDEFPAQWMIWEREPIEESVEKLNMMGIRSLVFHPCGNAPENADFMKMMVQNLDRLRKAFEYRSEGRDVYAGRQSVD